MPRRQGRAAPRVLDLRVQFPKRAAAAAAQPDEAVVAELLVERLLLASAPGRVDGERGDAPARPGARFRLPARVPIQVQVPGRFRYRRRGARVLLGLLRPL